MWIQMKEKAPFRVVEMGAGPYSASGMMDFIQDPIIFSVKLHSVAWFTQIKTRKLTSVVCFPKSTGSMFVLFPIFGWRWSSADRPKPISHRNLELTM